MTTSGAHTVRICPDCHRPMWSKHLEVCSGPAQRIAESPVREPECDCPPGWHLKDCPIAYWPENAA